MFPTAALLASLAAPVARATAEPYLAVRTGLPCSQCHVNRTGGGGRTDFGSVYAQTRLPMQQTAFLGRSIGDVAAIGADLRVLASGVTSDATPRTSLTVEELNVHVELRLIPDVLAVYVDETVGPGGAATREAFALLGQLPFAGHIKAGKFLLPYGLRLPDDAEFIRERTGFTYDNPDQGVEVSLEPGPLSFAVALSNGTQGADERDSDKQLTASAAVVFSRLRLGASASRNDAAGSRRDVFGGFGGFNLGRVTVLGEIDRIRDRRETGQTVRQLAAYLEGNLLLTRGLNLKTTYGFLDPDAAVAENARIRMRFGLDLFPVTFLHVSAFYLLLEDIPQATADRDRIMLELHTYF